MAEPVMADRLNDQLGHACSMVVFSGYRHAVEIKGGRCLGRSLAGLKIVVRAFLFKQGKIIDQGLETLAGKRLPLAEQFQLCQVAAVIINLAMI
jgi:hypothetical protein